MPNLDGGHYFLTTLIPVRLEPLQRDDGSFAAPSQVLREALATLPTAQQSPACIAAGFDSPFSRCTRTHFVRAALIDQPMFNGRDGGNALLQGLRKVNLLAHQPVDHLSCPFLLFTADFDAQPGEADGGFASWAEGLWQRTAPELRAVFSPCLGFDAVLDGPGFAAWLRRCQIDTTMSFNDYYTPMPDLHGYTLKGVGAGLVAGTLALSALAGGALVALGASLGWLVLAVPLAAIVSIAVAAALLWHKGSQPFPAGADADLPSVLKALYVQQRFALLAEDLQGADAATVHARFGTFAAQVRPDDTAAPTQRPGVIRSDGIDLPVHHLANGVANSLSSRAADLPTLARGATA
jgi:hypothetical protein